MQCTQASDLLYQNLKEVLKKREGNRQWKLIAMKKSVHWWDTTNYCFWMIQKSSTLLLTLIDADRASKIKKDVRCFEKNKLLPHMGINVHELVFNCKSYRWHRPSQKHRLWLQLFSPCEPSIFVTINNLRPLMKIMQKDRLIIVMTDQYS